MKINKVVVIGSGTMGSGIAAHLSNANIPVTLLDLKTEITEEAKKIKYGEVKDRPIYGEATIEQTKELIEEDINVVPLPFSSSKKTN